MNKILGSISVLAIGSGLSICALCGVGSSSATRPGPGLQLLSVVQAATLANDDGSLRSTAGYGLVAPVTIKTVTFHVSGMTCGGCVYGVRKVLTRLPGVSKAIVTYEESRAVVTYDPALVTVSRMITAIRTLGYTATVVAPQARG